MILEIIGWILFCIVLITGTAFWAAPFLLLLIPGWASDRLALRLKQAGKQDAFRVRRVRGTLDQQKSLPILGRDGGRGPAGGRLLLPRRSSSSTANALIAWLPAGICLAVGSLMIASLGADFLGVVGIVLGCCVVLGWMVAPPWPAAANHRVEVTSGTAAVGDLLNVHARNRRSHSQEPVSVRLLLCERILSTANGIPAWTQEVLWDEPLSVAEVALQPPFRSQFLIRIPEHLPGTYLASGYQLEWIIEVIDGEETTSYPLPVVK